MTRKTALTLMTASFAAIWLAIWLCFIFGCGGNIDPAGRVSVRSEISTWTMEVTK